jgi:hypothetical protein
LRGDFSAATGINGASDVIAKSVLGLPYIVHERTCSGILITEISDTSGTIKNLAVATATAASTTAAGSKGN